MIVLEQNKKIESKTKISSINYFKILLFLGFKNNSAYFNEIKNYLNRSSSQISITLKKLEIKGLIKRTKKRPQRISITKRGNSIKNEILRDILKFKDYKQRNKERTVIQENKNRINRNGYYNINSNINLHENNLSREDLFENYIYKVKKIIKKELIEDFGYHLPKTIIKDITRQMTNEIHDKLYEFF